MRFHGQHHQIRSKKPLKTAQLTSGHNIKIKFIGNRPIFTLSGCSVRIPFRDPDPSSQPISCAYSNCTLKIMTVSIISIYGVLLFDGTLCLFYCRINKKNCFVVIKFQFIVICRILKLMEGIKRS